MRYLRTMDIPLAVNGTLMRGLELNANLTAAGAHFVREAATAPEYRLWSIGDRHPAMLRARQSEGQREITTFGGRAWTKRTSSGRPRTSG